jgi:hypothetical protein
MNRPGTGTAVLTGSASAPVSRDQTADGILTSSKARKSQVPGRWRAIRKAIAQRRGGRLCDLDDRRCPEHR